MQMIFQDPYSSLNPRKTVGSIIGEPFIIHELERDEDKRKKLVQELMDRVGLNPEHYNRFPHEFSGGQRQRIGVARAIALKPKLVVADEPVSALDVSIQAQIINLLEELQRELGLTIIFIAHDLCVVRHVCDRVAVMYLGKIVEIAEADQLFDHPRHPYTGALLSAVPVPDPRLAREKQRQVLGGDVPVADQPAAGVPLPHALPEGARRRLQRRRAAAGGQGGRQRRRLPLPADRRGDRQRACRPPRRERRALRERPRSSPQGTRTAADAAAAIGCEVGAICKSLVFRVARRAAARHRRRAPTASTRRASAPRRPTPPSCASTPASRSAACRPSATPAPIETIVDEDLLAYDEVWAAAGTPS